MSAVKRKKPELPIFDAIRKPTAPPTSQMGKRRPEDKVHPSKRSSKHKKKEETTD